jgi:hypothetical protein
MKDLRQFIHLRGGKASGSHRRRRVRCKNQPACRGGKVSSFTSMPRRMSRKAGDARHRLVLTETKPSNFKLFARLAEHGETFFQKIAKEQNAKQVLGSAVSRGLFVGRGPIIDGIITTSQLCDGNEVDLLILRQEVKGTNRLAPTRPAPSTQADQAAGRRALKGERFPRDRPIRANLSKWVRRPLG